MIKPASLNDIRKELSHLERSDLEQMCLRLGKYRVENKELLSYLLFEAHDEQRYIIHIKAHLDELFANVPASNAYLIKKSIRKILRHANKHIKYSGLPLTELEVRIYFCMQMRSMRVSLTAGTVLGNLYVQQLKKIETVWSRLPEDLRFDYERELQELGVVSGP